MFKVIIWLKGWHSLNQIEMARKRGLNDIRVVSKSGKIFFEFEREGNSHVAVARKAWDDMYDAGLTPGKIWLMDDQGGYIEKQRKQLPVKS